MRLCRGILIFILLTPVMINEAWSAYNRQAVKNYADEWWNTDKTGSQGQKGTDGYVDYINWPTYTWYGKHNGEWASYNRGTNHNVLISSHGSDCANFGSQCLIAGGVDLGVNTKVQNSDRGIGRGGTIFNVVKLREVLKTIATKYEFNSVLQAPEELTVGDIVTWYGIFQSTPINHTTVVIGGSGRNVKLAAHTTDREDGTLSRYFKFFSKAIAFHIIGTQAKLPADQDNPVIIVRNRFTNQEIPEEGMTAANNVRIELRDSGEGLDGLAVWRSESQLDAGENADLTRGIFGDLSISGNSTDNLFAAPSAVSASPVYSKTYTLNDLPDDLIVVEAWDKAGNVASRVFTIDSKPPAVAQYAPQGSEVSISSSVAVAFTKALDETTISNQSMAVYDGWQRISGEVRYADERQLLADVNGDGDKTDYALTFKPQSGTFPAGRELEVYVFDSIRGKNGMRVDGNGDGREGGDLVWSFKTTVPPPSIQHEPVAQAREGEELVVTATVTAFASNIRKAELYYRNFSESQIGGAYNKVSMQMSQAGNGSNGARVKGVIPAGSVLSDRGLEYFIYAEDGEGKRAFLPSHITDPNSFTAQGIRLATYREENRDMIFGDADSGNDALKMTFFLPYDLPYNHRVDFEVYRTNYDFSQPIQGEPDAVQRNVTNSITLSRSYSFNFNGQNLMPGNYIYYLREKDALGNGVRNIVSAGRIRAARPLANVAVAVKPGTSQDTIEVIASGTRQKFGAATMFQSKDVYQPVGQTGSGPKYTFTLPHSNVQYGAAVYTKFGSHDILIGLSDVPKVNTNNAPEILTFVLTAEQTSGQPIYLSAKIDDLKKDGSAGQVAWAKFYYKRLGAAEFQEVVMSSSSGSDIYTAAIPPQEPDIIVQYYLKAKDNEGFESTDPWNNPTGSPYIFSVVRDVTAPKVVYTVPGNGQKVSIDATIQAGFSEDIDTRTLTAQNIRVVSSSGAVIAVGPIQFDFGFHLLKFKPEKLAASTTYTITLKGGIQDFSGNGLAGGDYQWSFITEDPLPVAITALSHSPEHFNSETTVMDFRSALSTSVNRVEIVLTNAATQEEFRITNDAGTPSAAVYPSTYTKSWDGKVNGSYIPDGEYSLRMEAVDRRFGVPGSSEFQPFMTLIRANANVIETRNEPFGIPNFDQYVMLRTYANIERDYRVRIGGTLPTSESIFPVGSGGRDFLFEGEKREWIKAGEMIFFERENCIEGIFIGSGDECSWRLDTSGVGKVEYKLKYDSPKGKSYLARLSDLNDFYRTPDIFRTIGNVERNQTVVLPFQIQLTPNLNFSYEIFGAHIVSGKIGEDYENNPEVETKLNLTFQGGDRIEGTLTAKNISPPVRSFLIDRKPPAALISVTPEVFSPVFHGVSTVTFSVFDNLSYDLLTPELKLFDSRNNFLRTFFELAETRQIARAYLWDGKDVSGQMLEDGVYFFKGKVSDKAGNATFVDKKIILDKTPPTVHAASLVVLPGNHPRPALFSSKDNRIEARLSLSDELSPSVSAELTFKTTSGQIAIVHSSTFSVSPLAQSGAIAFDWKDAQGNFLPDGTYRVSLKVTDHAGNSANIMLPAFVVDRTPPVVLSLYVDLPVFSPDDGPEHEGDGNADQIRLHYSLSESGYVTVDIQNVLSKPLASYTDGILKKNGTFSWDGKINRRFAADGAYVFRVKSVDDVGNESESGISAVKNMIPAEIVSPFVEFVSGIVTIRGIALDPTVNDTVDFDHYQVWVRQGENIDFSLEENNPVSPDTSAGKWVPIPVPSGNQKVSDPAYPFSNVSYRAILNTVLATWDTRSLSVGKYTLLLTAKDQTFNDSHAVKVVEVAADADNSEPNISMISPSVNSAELFDVKSETAAMGIEYILVQGDGKKSDVTVEIFKMESLSKYGPIVFRKEFFSQISGAKILWDFKNSATKAYVQSGFYKARITSRDTDGMGVASAEANVQVNLTLDEPLKVLKFQPANSVAALGAQVPVTYRLSKDAKVTISVFDLNGALVSKLADSVLTSGGLDRQIIFSNGSSGLFTLKMEVVSIDGNESKDSAATSIAVGSSEGSVNAAIISPEEGEVVQGKADFVWTASAQGEHYPPQNFSALVQANGQEVVTALSQHSWTLSSSADFNQGKFDGVEVESSLRDGAVILARGENQTQNARDIGGEQTIGCDTNLFAQSFSALKGGRIEFIHFLFHTGNPNYGGIHYKIEIWSDLGGTPGSVLASKDLGCIATGKSETFSANFKEYSIDVRPNEKYWAVLREEFNVCGPVGGSSSYIHGAPGNRYPRGEALRKSSGGGCQDTWQVAVGSDYDYTFWVFMAPFAPAGSYTSPVFDAGLFLNSWGSFQTESQESGQLQYKTQSSADGIVWDKENPAFNGQIISSALKRYIRWKAYLSVNGLGQSPVVHDATIHYDTSHSEPKDFSFEKQFEETVWYNHPKFLGDSPKGLRSFFDSELAGKNITAINYAVVSKENSSVAQNITSENGFSQVKAVTHIKQAWTTLEDSNLANGHLGGINKSFSNDPNPKNFSVEGPFNFAEQKLEPIIISKFYPSAGMNAENSVKNKFLFWENLEGQTIDNPYVAVDAANKGWKLSLQYPDGASNDSLIIGQDISKDSNKNRDAFGTPLDVDDDFTVKIAPNAAPKVFVEIKGTANSGYSLFFSRSDENVYKQIPALSTQSVANGTLAHWDATGMNGAYKIKLVSQSGNGITEAVRNIKVGTFVPGAAVGSPLAYVTAPYNKAYLEFPGDSLEVSTLVTITPVKVSDSKVVISTVLPQPIGVLYELKPSGIRFAKDSNGKVIKPAKLVTRFLPEELHGVDPGQLTLYSVQDDGALDPLDARVTFDSNGNGKLDPDEIVTVESLVTHFSYYFAIPDVQPPELQSLPAVSSDRKINVIGKAEVSSIVDLFVNGGLSASASADGEGNFKMEVVLVKGTNLIDATATRILNDKGVKKVSKKSAGLKVNVSFDRTVPFISNPSAQSLVSGSPVIHGFGLPSSDVSLFENGIFKGSAAVDGVGEFTIKPANSLTTGLQVVTLTNKTRAPPKTLFSDPLKLKVDASPPVTTIHIQENVASQYTISFTALDAGPDETNSAAREIRYRVDNGEFIVYADPFNLNGSAHVVEFQSSDIFNNWETLKKADLSDKNPPDRVEILAENRWNSSDVILKWNAPGDDGNTGQAARCEIRYSTKPITMENFEKAEGVQSHLPNTAGSLESLIISGLNSGTKYYFAVRSFDTIGNASLISNIVSIITLIPDITAPEVSFVYPRDGAQLTSDKPKFVLAFEDSQSGVNLASVQIFLNGSDVTDQTEIFSSSAVFRAQSPALQGNNVLEILIEDQMKNRGNKKVKFFVDSIPPEVSITLLPKAPLKAGLAKVFVRASEALREQKFDLKIEGRQKITVPLQEISDLLWEGTFIIDKSVNSEAAWIWMGKDSIGLEGSKITSGEKFLMDNAPPLAFVVLNPPSPLTQGVARVTLVPSEALENSTLSYTINGETSVFIPLTKRGDQWVGEFTVPKDAGARFAEFDWSGTDLAGNFGNALDQTKRFEFDALPPIGDVKINDGILYTTSPEVTLTFDAVDFKAGGRAAPKTILISFDNGLTYAEEPYVKSKKIVLRTEGGARLPRNEGIFKQILVKFKDAAGNVSAAAQAGIVLDISVPLKSAVLLKKK